MNLNTIISTLAAQNKTNGVALTVVKTDKTNTEFATVGTGFSFSLENANLDGQVFKSRDSVLATIADDGVIHYLVTAAPSAKENKTSSERSPRRQDEV